MEQSVDPPLSRSARKRLAREAAKAATANGSESEPQTIPKPEAENIASPPPVHEVRPSPEDQKTPTQLNGSQTKVQKDRQASVPIEPRTSSSFKPELPDLPGPSANSLPANRKRKTPQDFTPFGPHGISTPSSPSKSSVKFEDGVAPGEGKEGEKVIPKAAPKNRNVVERTVWTFIMIGGFIGESLVLSMICTIFALMISFTMPWTSVYDPSRPSVSNACLQGGHCAV